MPGGWRLAEARDEPAEAAWTDNPVSNWQMDAEKKHQLRHLLMSAVSDQLMCWELGRASLPQRTECLTRVLFDATLSVSWTLKFVVFFFFKFQHPILWYCRPTVLFHCLNINGFSPVAVSTSQMDASHMACWDTADCSRRVWNTPKGGRVISLTGNGFSFF